MSVKLLTYDVYRSGMTTFKNLADQTYQDKEHLPKYYLRRMAYWETPLEFEAAYRLISKVSGDPNEHVQGDTIGIVGAKGGLCQCYIASNLPEDLYTEAWLTTTSGGTAFTPNPLFCYLILTPGVYYHSIWRFDSAQELYIPVLSPSDIISCYIVGDTPFAADWLSLSVGGAPLTPQTDKLYIVLTAGDYYNFLYRFDSTQNVYMAVSGGSGGTTDYADLTNKPSINNVTLSGNKTTTDLGLFDGNYNNLTNKPTIPTATSDLNNDSGFITNLVNDLANYYLKSQTYSKTEVDTIASNIKNSRFELVQTLPTTDIQTNVIYLVPRTSPETSNVKDEYINLDGTTSGWEKIGSTDVDLSDYVTNTALSTALADYTTTADLLVLLAAKQDALTFDHYPVLSSVNPVESNGIRTELDVRPVGFTGTLDQWNQLSQAQKEQYEWVALLDVESSENEFGIVSASGTELYLTPTSKGKVLLHTVYGMSVQDGIPTPSVPIQIDSSKADFICSGKNLLVYPYYETSKTVNAVDFTVNQDGTVLVDGQASGDTSLILTDYITDNRYMGCKLTGCPSGGGVDCYGLRIRVVNLDGSFKSQVFDYGSGAVIPEILTTEKYYIDVFVYDGYDADNLLFHPMLSLEDVVDLSYEPYEKTFFTTDIILRTIEVDSSDVYNLVINNKYYVADTLDFIEDTGFVITRRIGHIASYDGEPINTKWMSSMDVYSSGMSPSTGAVVDYILDSSVTESPTTNQSSVLFSVMTHSEASFLSSRYEPHSFIYLEYPQNRLGAVALIAYNNSYKSVVEMQNYNTSFEGSLNDWDSLSAEEKNNIDIVFVPE